MASSHQPKDFDVFLSFRGEDTRRGFVSHLYKALDQHGIRTFIDDNLTRGENISEELFKAIENSSASIVVFSKNYASSSWCLDELAKIIECTPKKVLPVFYQVDPSEVRKLKGDFGKALTKLEKRIKDKTKVQRWREDLTNAANISGWDYKDKDKDSGTESELVQKIVEEILNSDFIQMPSNEQLVGINSRMKAVTKLLDIESNDVRMVGITGLGGIGKTTIAKAIYERFSNHFKAKSFVENVREWSKTEQGKIHLQEALIKGISEDKNLRVSTVYEGTASINRILRLKRVLIILDDVDNADQIETLLGRCECFARSRIILTTRNKRLLHDRNGLSTYSYDVEELDEHEAIELFRMHAFPSNKVPEDYLELEKKAISYAKGLPLALKVMGCDLCKKTITFWNDALDYYKKNLHEDIQKILRRSYEGLTENERNIFLDIACFFKGYDMRYNMIKDVLKACGLNPEYGIGKLIDKCLIDQYDDYLSMHDLLQQMGMDIVRQEAPQNPGERSRLWCYEEALDILTEDKGSVKIRSIILWPPKSEKVEVQIKAQFCKMKNLRLLLIRNVRCCKGPLECLPNGLSLLDWREYPFSSWPPNFFPKKLVVLNMPFILLKEPVLKQGFVSLRHVDFSYCNLITKIPDLSMTPNITTLDHSYCDNLVEIDDSVGRLDKLEVWDLTSCVELETLPNCLTMKSLTSFDLDECYRIKKFPNILHEMKGVDYLTLEANCTNELPLSFGNLIGLRELRISSNSGVAHFPGSIYNLQHIEKLSFYGNFIFPKNVEIDRQPMCNSLGCSSKYVFPMLKRLVIGQDKICSEIEFILNYCCPLTLEELHIYDSKVVTLPESMSRCERLHTFIIKGCNELREILRLPHGVRRVEVESCHSLDLQSLFQLLTKIIRLPPNLPPCLGDTSHMLMFPHSYTLLPFCQSRICEDGFEVAGDENDIPDWFNHQRDGNLISFSIGPEFPTIALCIAFRKKDSYCDRFYAYNYYVIISINGSERTLARKFIQKYGRFDYLCFYCRRQRSLQELFPDLKLTDRNHVEIHSEIINFNPPRSRDIADPIVERIGVHVECNCPPTVNRHLSLQLGLGLPMDTENGSDLGVTGSAFTASKHLHPLMLKSLRRAARADMKYIEQPQHDPDLGLPMDTDLGLALDSSNVDLFDLGSSSVAQPVTPQDKKRKRKVKV
ncbi:TMV resistance protein N-like [Quercus lobata]|uniref:TIR domain-containing protein n=1 Tax=Quercus lobata TaxID=97700 RepID=A0A7N2LC91_QUELO|nr:TMV resistance protein N-like [Quercus lobata]XP_030962912.1 TMV resistance protein N-like [Quercus lobata]XP_030962913.1 TMV resistance protein N-like [Quercus lobata]